MDVPRGTRSGRRDAYTAQLELEVQAMRQESEVLRQQSEADQRRIASLKVAQREMQQFMSRFMASQQGTG